MSASSVLVLFVCICMLSGCESQTPSQTYTHSSQLDTAGNVFLYWKYNTSFITMELHGRTSGWVGVGISPGGSMAGADMIVGWVKSGVVTITDRHGTGNTFPPIDSVQNIDDLSGGESNGWTWIKFTRQFAACEVTQDLAITDNTMRVIYAYGDTDPTGDDIARGNYHGANRGKKDILFKASADINTITPSTGENLESFSLTTGGVTIPTKNTYYSCRLLQFPSVTSKRQIVRISPLIQSGNELYVHHIVIMQCSEPLPTGAIVGAEGECYTDEVQVRYSRCSQVIAAWAVGGGDFVYPPDVGFPFGEPGDPNYVVIEMHYDNPNLNAGVVDDSGLTFYYTSELRTHDAGVIQAGQAINPFTHLIPPHAKSFLTYGDCPGVCLEKAMDEAGESEINIFAVVLHTHLLGRKATLRQIRNQTELPFVANDDSYDFNFQATRYVRPERIILPGDDLQVVCDYDSSSRDKFTYGGLSTYSEMCMAFIVYYPRIQLGNCETAIIQNQWFYQVLDLPKNTSVTWTTPDPGVQNTLADAYFTGTGITLEQYINSIPMNDSVAQELSYYFNLLPKYMVCDKNGVSPPGLPPYIMPLNITKPYVEPALTCVQPESTTTTKTTATTTIATMISTTSGTKQQGPMHVFMILPVSIFVFSIRK